MHNDEWVLLLKLPVDKVGCDDKKVSQLLMVGGGMIMMIQLIEFWFDYAVPTVIK